MKNFFLFILLIFINLSLFCKDIPFELDPTFFTNEILKKIVKVKDKEFIESCYYYDIYSKKYKLFKYLEEFKKDRIIKIFDSLENYKIDWETGKIYGSSFSYSMNNYDFANNSLKAINIAHEDAKKSLYKSLKNINIYESISVLNYFEERGEKNRELYSLIDRATLYKVDYPDVNTVQVTYFIDIYGDNSLMSILMSERDMFVEDLKGYMGFNYITNYTGIIIDARDELTSFDGYKVKVKPAIFVVIKDDEDRLVFDKENILPEVIKNKGMIKYSYNINGDHNERVGDNPLKIVACGVGDKSGSYIIITVIDAKRMLSSEVTRNAIQNGKIVIIINQ